jgi:hypothetical protein
MPPLAARVMNYFKATGPHLYEIRFLIAGFGIVYYGVYKIQKAGKLSDKESDLNVVYSRIGFQDARFGFFFRNH